MLNGCDLGFGLDFDDKAQYIGLFLAIKSILFRVNNIKKKIIFDE